MVSSIGSYRSMQGLKKNHYAPNKNEKAKLVC